MRERLTASRSCFCARGITPARAGKTYRQSLLLLRSRDHPRSCGKDQTKIKKKLDALGSPPLVRERPSFRAIVHRHAGITPARAGKTITPFFFIRRLWDHPRSCGKDTRIFTQDAGNRGSPPLVRERRSIVFLWCSMGGITPARAGKTVMDPFICAISLLPVFKIYLISLQDICPPKNIKHVSSKYSYHNPLFKEASHYVYSIIKSVL